MTQKKYFVYGAEKIRLQNKNIWTLFMKIKKTEMFKNTLKNKWNHYNKLIQNIDLLKYGINNKTNIYLDSVMSNGFIPMITKPTRKTHSTSTLIDHIHSNFKCINSLSGIVITDVADHYGVFHAIPTKKTKHLPQSAQFRRKINDKKNS